MARLGFVTPVEVTGSLLSQPIPPIETTKVGALFKLTNPSSSGKEYWLVENRQQTGFDEGLVSMTADGHGIVIYHVDDNVFDRTYWTPNEAECVSGGIYRGTNNCDCATLPPNSSNGEKWYGISVEQADGLYHIEQGLSRGYWQDFYNSITGKTAFTETTTPNTTSYYGCATSVAVTGISGSTGTMTANLFGPTSCRVAPASIDFGTVFLPSFRDTSFTITNVGGGVLSGTVAEPCGDYSILSGGGSYNLSAGQTVTVTVRFAPVSTGTRTCTVATGSALCGDVSFTGFADIPPACSVGPSALDFGTVAVGSAIDTTFTITNTGGGMLSGEVSEVCGPYEIVSGGGSYILGAGQTRSVIVRFAPDSVGVHECTVETGTASCSDVACTGVGGAIDAVGDERTSGPTSFRLAPDTPNPLRPGSAIAYELPVSCPVRLEVFSAQGRRLATLIDSVRPAGRQTIRWDGRSIDGTEAPSGVCFLRMQAGSSVTIKRMVLLR